MHDFIIVFLTAFWCSLGTCWNGATARGRVMDGLVEATTGLCGPIIWIVHGAFLISDSLEKKRAEND